jgi:osmotically-inducible protein OsmY
MIIKKDEQEWMGPKGFDEANYYREENSELGIGRPDERIQLEAQEAISRNEQLNDYHIDVSVIEGILVLKGSVKWKHEMVEAQNAVCFLSGVKSVTNLIIFEHH